MTATTMELLDLARKEWAKRGITEAEALKEMGFNPTAMSKAKTYHRLSPVMAGRIAEMLGLDAIKWIAIAAIENAKNSKARTLLTKHLRAVTSVALYLFQVFANHRPLRLQPGVIGVSNPVNHSPNSRHMDPKMPGK